MLEKNFTGHFHVIGIFQKATIHLIQLVGVFNLHDLFEQLKPDSWKENKHFDWMNNFFSKINLIIEIKISNNKMFLRLTWSAASSF